MRDKKQLVLVAIPLVGMAILIGLALILNLIGVL